MMAISIYGNVILQLNMILLHYDMGSFHSILGCLVELLELTLQLMESKYFLHAILHIEESELVDHLVMVLFKDLVLFDQSFYHQIACLSLAQMLNLSSSTLQVRVKR
jgi:hypothetical protein